MATSDDTVGKAAASVAFHQRHKRRKLFLTANSIGKRYPWVEDNKGQDGRRVIFTDESAIEMGLDTIRWTIRRAREQYLPQHLQRTFRSPKKSRVVRDAIAQNNKWDLVQLSIPPSEVKEKG
jgi:hypothetical protein